MAEALLRSLPDSDGDGIPDILSQILGENNAFGLHKDNWKNRRALIVWTAVTAWGACLLMVLIWAWKVIFTKEDIPSNLLNFGTTMFWAMNMFATSLILGYAGISQADTSSYRKHMTDLAKSMPAPITNGDKPGSNGGFTPPTDYYNGNGEMGTNKYAYPAPQQEAVQPTQSSAVKPAPIPQLAPPPKAETPNATPAGPKSGIIL